MREPLFYAVLMAVFCCAAVLVARPLLAGGGTTGTGNTTSLAEIPAPTEEKTEVDVSEVPGLITALIQAAKDKNWTLLVSSILMLLVFFTRAILLRFLPDEAKRAALPWISVGGATVVVAAATLAAGGSWWDAINGGFITGTAASGLWSLIGKHIIKLFRAEDKARIPIDTVK